MRPKRWAIVGLVFAAELALLTSAMSLLVFLIDPGATSPEYASEVDGWRDWLVWFVLGAPFVLLQALLLLPLRKPAGMLERGHSLRLSIAAGGLLGAALAFGAIAALLELFRLWDPIVGWNNGDGFVWLFFGGLAAMWALMTPLVYVFSRGKRRETFVWRLSALLFTGTLIEVAATIPIDVMVRRRTDCYCAQGTFFTFMLCLGVGLVTVGPVIAVPFLARRRKRWCSGRCAWCAYDMKGLTDAERCPECGLGWRAEKPRRGGRWAASG